MGKTHLLCRPVVWTREGGDHTGMDAFMRCRCGRQTTHHIECERVTDEVKRLLKLEWRSRRTERTAPSHPALEG